MTGKIFLTDVDGTLDYQGRGIMPPVLEQAKRYVAEGGSLGLATGRAILSTEQIARKIGINAPSILYGGSMIYDFQQNRPLWLCPLSRNVMEIIRDVLHCFSDVALLVYTEQSIHILNTNDMFWKKGIAEERDKRFCNNKITGQLLKLSLCGERSSLEAIRDSCFAGDEFTYAFSSQHFAEVVAKGAGKGKAMQVMSSMTDTPLKHFIVMGDAQNDLDMMCLAGFSYALGNAIASVKIAADMILPHCAEDGAAAGFLHARQQLLQIQRD